MKNNLLKHTLITTCFLINILPSSVHAGIISLYSGNGSVGATDPNTLFSASGTLSLAAMDAAVQGGTYPNPTTGAIIGRDGSFVYQVPGSKVINSQPLKSSGYYETQFTLPALLTAVTLDLDVVGDDEGYAYLNGNQLGYFDWQSSWAYNFNTSDLNFFQTGINTLTFAVANTGGGPTGLSYGADINYSSTSNPEVPAPATLALFGLGLAGLGWTRRKKA